MITSDENAEKQVIRIRIKFNDPTDSKETENASALLKTIENNMLMEMPLSGIRDISKVFLGDPYVMEVGPNGKINKGMPMVQFQFWLWFLVMSYFFLFWFFGFLVFLFRFGLDLVFVSCPHSLVKQWTVETEGTNLQAVLACQGVDATKTYSNSIVEMISVLGIEVSLFFVCIFYCYYYYYYSISSCLVIWFISSLPFRIDLTPRLRVVLCSASCVL
jgi:hypothetical protein